MKLSAIKEADTNTQLTVNIPFHVKDGQGGESVENLRVVYRALTAEILEMPAPEALAAVVIEWDLEDDNGSKLVPTVENLRKQRADFLAAIVGAIGGDFFPAKKR